jgi:hypothetical protein
LELSPGAAILVGLAFMLGTILARMPQNKLCRFMFLFLQCVPLNVAINYVNVCTFASHKMGWSGTFILPLLLAIWQGFGGCNRTNSNTGYAHPVTFDSCQILVLKAF